MLIEQLNAWENQPDLFKDYIIKAKIKKDKNYRTPKQIQERLSTIEKLIHDLKEEYKDLENPLGHNILASQSTFPYSDSYVSPLSDKSRGGKSNRKTKRRKPKRKSIKKK